MTMLVCFQNATQKAVIAGKYIPHDFNREELLGLVTTAIGNRGDTVSLHSEQQLAPELGEKPSAGDRSCSHKQTAARWGKKKLFIAVFPTTKKKSPCT